MSWTRAIFWTLRHLNNVFKGVCRLWQPKWESKKNVSEPEKNELPRRDRFKLQLLCFSDLCSSDFAGVFFYNHLQILFVAFFFSKLLQFWFFLISVASYELSWNSKYFRYLISDLIAESYKWNVFNSTFFNHSRSLVQNKLFCNY